MDTLAKLWVGKAVAQIEVVLRRVASERTKQATVEVSVDIDPVVPDSGGIVAHVVVCGAADLRAIAMLHINVPCPRSERAVVEWIMEWLTDHDYSEWDQRSDRSMLVDGTEELIQQWDQSLRSAISAEATVSESILGRKPDR